MSNSQPLTLPQPSEDPAEALSHHHDTVCNTNQGSGTQYNATQAGGYGNTQYNASQQHFHYHEPSRPQPKQLWRIPRQAAANYAGGEQVVCVLSGMGGVGKSESVLQFLKKHNNALRKRFWAVFWVDCTSEATTRADFKSICNLCGWASNNTDFFCGAKDQLASFDEQVILILDNCDDPKTNFNRYIPSNPSVSIVLTTRLSDAGKYASMDAQDMRQRLHLRMDGLDPASATQLILGASSVQSEDDETIQQANQIADALDYHPLAIVVAGSLIQNNIYSLTEYAEALKEIFVQRELLDAESELTTHRKVSTTFELSASALQRLAATDPSAQEALALLELLGFMHHQGISEDMFARAWVYEEKVLSEYTNQSREPQHLSMWHVAQARKYFPHATLDARKRAFRKARAHLIRLTLIKQNSEDNTTYVHSLVHLWARERLQHVIKPWTAAASILALSAQGSYRWEPYSPHLSLHCEANFRSTRSGRDVPFHGEKVCRIWCNFAWQMLYSQHAQALDVAKVFSREVELLPDTAADSLLVSEPQHILGVLYVRMGDASQAVAMLEDVVRLRANLDESHPMRLISQYELASAYLTDGRTSRAIEIYEHVRHMKQKQKLAVDHPDRLVCERALAAAYLEDGRITQAIEIYEYVVHIHDRRLAADHPQRLLSQHEMARAYLRGGRITQAIETLEQVVHTEEKKLAADHPDRLASQHELARAYLKDGRTSQAIELFEHVVHIESKKLAADHPGRLTSQYELARAYLKDGHVSQAIEILEHVVRVEGKLADSDARRLASQHELARAYWGANRFAEADELMSHVVGVRQHILPETHPCRVASEEVLANVRADPENPGGQQDPLEGSR
ncbi:hypothetical protein MBLNU13_g08157t2 [Cladosporium sp. NU13]